MQLVSERGDTDVDAFLERISKLSHGKLALLAAELYQRAGTADRAAEPIAITAMACRVPGGGNTPEAFWSFLERGGDAIEPIPEERLAMTGAVAAEMDGPGANWGGFLRGVDEFDPALFGISPKEAESMDPQQRILLEVCWEALENTGTPIDALDSTTGVFMGVSGIDYALLSQGSGRDQNSYVVTGVANAILAGRISYVFGLNGPSAVTDTACSASAAAIHLACQSLRARECDQALAGGINLLLLPQITQTISGLQSLARDGRCKAFSADADGFVRSEGCGVIVLRRLSDAVSRAEPILGVIRGSAWNQDGKSGGLTAPNGTAQEQVIRAALAAAKVSPDQVSLYRGARHRHRTRRSHRDLRTWPRIRCRTPAPSGSASGLGQDQYRSPRGGRGCRWRDEGGAVAAAPVHPAAPARRKPQSSHQLGQPAICRSPRRGSLGQGAPNRASPASVPSA